MTKLGQKAVPTLEVPYKMASELISDEIYLSCAVVCFFKKIYPQVITFLEFYLCHLGCINANL